jgi:prepilin-type N-terminal cleavage/methylation domain-containing protein
MRARSRTGFTLIELMVAMALTLFIMVILSQAFVTALETFSGMKAIGDMQQQLRTAEVMLRDDLSQDHLEGKRRLSDLTTVANGSELVAHHPQAGFFAVRRSTPQAGLGAPYHNEGSALGVPSYRAVDHMIYITVKRKGNRQENFFNTALQNNNPAVLATFFNHKTAYDVPKANMPYATQTQPYPFDGLATTGFYSSQWAEVLYFLVRTGSTEEPNNPASTLGTPTYALYRAQFVMVPDGTYVSGQFNNALGLERSTFASLSCNPNPEDGKLAFYSPADASAFVAAQNPPVKRVIPDLAPPFNPEADARIFNSQTATLVCPNVISFQVQILRIANEPNLFIDVQNITGKTYGIYDTARLGVTGYPNFGLRGIQVTLRVWDNKTRQTRQATVVQDL